MKKRGLLFFLVISLTVAAYAFSFEDMDQEGISLKAGPTDVTEELSLPWVEAVLYPRVVEKGQEVFVEVQLAAPVKSVKLDLEGGGESLALFSDDGKNWNRVLKVSPEVPAGIHLARVQITGKNDKSIQRTLDLIVKERLQAGTNIPLTVLNAAPVFENGEVVRQLLPGIQVTALYKAPFYRVQLDDGREGWIEASRIKEPTEELFLLGCRAYQNKDYAAALQNFKQALRFDQRHAQSHFYLAKIYWTQKKLNLAADEIKQAITYDPENEQFSAFADTLAGKLMAAQNYAKVLELKPELLLSQLKNKVVVAQKEVKTTKVAAAAPAVSREILGDSIALVKNTKTAKGTVIAKALNSVLNLTKSLGTKIFEDGWHVAAASDGMRVIYACRQEKGGKLEDENFEWKIDMDRGSAAPLNENARLLMNRW